MTNQVWKVSLSIINSTNIISLPISGTTNKISINVDVNKLY